MYISICEPKSEKTQVSSCYRFDFLVGGSPAPAKLGPDSALRFLAVRV